MTPKEKYYAIVQKLIERTDAGEALWQQTGRAGWFALALQGFNVVIGTQPSGESYSSTDVVLELYDPSGTRIDSMRDVDIADQAPSKKPFYDAMMALYDDARRTAMGVDSALDSILKTLDS